MTAAVASKGDKMVQGREKPNSIHIDDVTSCKTPSCRACFLTESEKLPFAPACLLGLVGEENLVTGVRSALSKGKNSTAVTDNCGLLLSGRKGWDKSSKRMVTKKTGRISKECLWGT